ncbi:hypothetical protein C8J57DRAFT_1730175 [Mycena rebaudengoi]|nr:hypothetical protein C8J57DRAFT_1730175 [Mycena rebaudengoi]
MCTLTPGAIPTAEVKQHCQKVRLELPTSNRKPSDPIVAGIPTLHDLLNPDTVDDEPIDEEALFNNPDPYGIKDCEGRRTKRKNLISLLLPSSFAVLMFSPWRSRHTLI